MSISTALNSIHKLDGTWWIAYGTSTTVLLPANSWYAYPNPKLPKFNQLFSDPQCTCSPNL